MLWKKIDIVNKESPKSFRSFQSKQRGAFHSFYENEDTTPKHRDSQKQRFCQQFLKRYYSAEKPIVSNKERNSLHLSSITPVLKNGVSNKSQKIDIFSLLREQQRLKNRRSLLKQNKRRQDSTNNLQISKQMQNKLIQAYQNIHSLQKDHKVLKKQIENTILKCNKQVKKVVKEINSHQLSKNHKIISSVLSEVKNYKNKESSWQKQQRNILLKYNMKLQNLI